MAGKEKENKKRKGKQRLVGEMAIRWIAVVHFLYVFVLAFFLLQYVELVRSKFRGAVMRVFRDRRADSDRSLRLGWAIFVWLMTRQLVSDVENM